MEKKSKRGEMKVWYRSQSERNSRRGAERDRKIWWTLMMAHGQRRETEKEERMMARRQKRWTRRERVHETREEETQREAWDVESKIHWDTGIYSHTGLWISYSHNRVLRDVYKDTLKTHIHVEIYKEIALVFCCSSLLGSMFTLSSKGIRLNSIRWIKVLLLTRLSLL